jgi:HK97 gp10 family phage protein
MISATAIFRPRGDLGRFVEAKISPALRKGIEDGCVLIEQRAKEKCPVDTGLLQSRITHKVEELAKTIRGRVFVDDVHYAAYVEFGTGIAGAASPGAGAGPYSQTWPGMPAQPYMRPAFDESRAEVIEGTRAQVGLALA